jgi:hypothetical protein
MVGGGLGLLVPWATGIGSPLIEPTTDQTLVGWAGAIVRAGWDVGPATTLWLGGEAGGLLPHVEVAYGEEVVATFGSPLLSASLAVEVRLP